MNILKQAGLLENTKNLVKGAILPVIFGIITTILYYSGFGSRGVHISQLPLILRVINGNYLVNDFCVNEGSSSVARLGYSQTIASLTTLLGGIDYLPILYITVTLISNIALALITFLFARTIFNESDLAGILASAFVMSVFTFELGYTANIYTTTLIPRTFVRPLIFASIFIVAIYGRLTLGLILCGLASFIQPLYGLLFGGLMMISYIYAEVINNNINIIDLAKKTWLPLLIYVFYSSFLMLPQLSQESISSEQFIYILAYFRAPHHYLPSTFSLNGYLNALGFLFAAGLAWYRWTKSASASSHTVRFINCFIVLIVLFCLGGYVFVEIIPTRIWTTAQTFRLLIAVKWLGLIYIAGLVANLIKKKEITIVGLYLLSINLSGLIGLVSLIDLLNNLFKEKLPRLNSLLSLYNLIILFVFVVLYYFTPLFDFIVLWLFYALIFTISCYNKKILFSFIAAGMFFISVATVDYYSDPYRIYNQDFSTEYERSLANINLKSIINPKFEIIRVSSYFGDSGKEIANFSKNNTPEDSIFLTPVYFGHFRLIAERAIVVDYQSFPFTDKGIIEWYNRIINCYGEYETSGFDLVDEFNENYRKIDDHRLRNLQEKYNISYAVLYKETITNYPVIHGNSVFKLVDLKKNQEDWPVATK